MQPFSTSGWRPARVRSIGFVSRAPWPAGIAAVNFSTAALSGTGASKPERPKLSASSVPAPPVEVRIAIRRPLSTGWVASAAGISMRSPNVCARMIPRSRKKASYARSLPAIAPVCEAAARAPAAERPTFRATIDLPARLALSAARLKLSA